MIDDLIRSPAFHNLPLIEHQDFVAEFLHQCKVMADKKKRQLFLLL